MKRFKETLFYLCTTIVLWAILFLCFSIGIQKDQDHMQSVREAYQADMNPEILATYE